MTLILTRKTTNLANIIGKINCSMGLGNYEINFMRFA